MRQHAFVRRPAARRHGSQQGGVKPTAVLVTALEVEIGSAAQTRILLNHRRPAHPRVKPDVKYILFALKLLTATVGTLKAGRKQFRERTNKPSIGPFAV